MMIAIVDLGFTGVTVVGMSRANVPINKPSKCESDSRTKDSVLSEYEG